jgi:hypothetical protein
VRDLIEADGDAKVSDLHVWQVGAQAWCAALAVVADAPQDAAAYRERLLAIQQLRHVTVEVHRCPGDGSGAGSGAGTGAGTGAGAGAGAGAGTGAGLGAAT